MREAMPARWSMAAVARPAGPAPTISTGSSRRTGSEVSVMDVFLWEWRGRAPDPGDERGRPGGRGAQQPAARGQEARPGQQPDEHAAQPGTRRRPANMAQRLDGEPQLRAD